MINSRSIDDLSPNARAWFTRFHAHVVNELGLFRGLDWEVCQTLRDREYHNKLYEQGRTTPGPIVTWTRDSRHLSGEAWDIFVLKDGKAVWESPLYGQIAEVGKRMGLECGYYWKGKKRDPGHYQTPQIIG